MADEQWVGAVNTLTSRYMKGAERETMRKRLFWALLNKRGLIEKGVGGVDLTWQVRYLQPPVTPYRDAGTVDYQRINEYLRCTLPWRSYVSTQSMTKGEVAMHKGPSNIVDKWKELLPNLKEGVQDKISTELYVDGNATGNTNRFHGLESCLAAGGTVQATDRIAVPNDNYAGHYTTLGQISGTWSADLPNTAGIQPNYTQNCDWPEGNGSTDYDYFAPKLVNYKSTKWTGQTDFYSNSERAVRQAIAWTRVNNSDECADLVLLANSLFVDFKNYQSSKMRTIVPAKEANDLGFPNALMFDGAIIDTEFGVPAGVGYGITLNQIDVQSVYPDIFSVDGPTWDPTHLAWLLSVTVMGNLRLRPKGLFKLAAYA